jgi:predicted DNA-binding protein YlxM (UPF0122 family)
MMRKMKNGIRIPTPKERDMLTRRIAGESVPSIAESYGVSKQCIYQTMKQLEPLIAEELRRAKYGLGEAIVKMVELTDAKETKFFHHKGKIVEQVAVNDNTTQLAARREMLRLHNAYPATDDVQHGNTILQIVVKNIGSISHTTE